MKNRIFLSICLLLILGILLGLTACGEKPDTEEETLDSDTFHFPYDDLPDVEESDAAYLLDPDFTITAENVSDCIYDYFSAPSILYYDIFFFPYDETPFINNEKTADFAAVFQDVTWEQISEEDLFISGIDPNFSFCNAIGVFQVTEAQGATYISFSHNYDFVNEPTFFYANGVHLLSDIIETAISLEDVSGKTDPNLKDYLDYVNSYNAYDIYNALPDISESEAAYLLDPEFTVTEENFIDCVYDYFTAPATLQFGNPQSSRFTIEDPEKTAAFAEVVRDLSPTLDSAASPSDLSGPTIPSEEYQGSYNFSNAIGSLSLYSGEDLTHVEFSRSNSFVHDKVEFYIPGNLFSELTAIGDSLQKDAEEVDPVVWEPKHTIIQYHSGYHTPEEDFPSVQESDAAYLLDPEFTVTEENFSDCMDDYFAAPSILFYSFRPLYDFEQQFIQDEKALDFADVFHDLTVTPVSREEQTDYYTTNFLFRNAIGSLSLEKQDGRIYIDFQRQNDAVNDRITFYIEETDLIKELNQVAVSLNDIFKDSAYEMNSVDTSRDQSTETKPKDWESYLSGNIAGEYDFEDAALDCEQSDASYLLDPDFAVTPDNFAECMNSYFSAPTLYFQSCLDDTVHKTMSDQSRFAKVLQIQYPTIGKLNPDDYHTDYTPEYCFQNAFGRIVMYSCTTRMNYTFLAFYRDTGSTQTVSYFYIQDNHKTVSELYKIGKYVKQLAQSTYHVWDDMPAIKNSDAAYLTDSYLTITEENFYDCIYDYLTAPTMLYFENCFEETRRIQDPEKTKAFAEILRDLPLTQVSEKNLSM